MHGLEHGGKFSFGIEVPRGRDSNRTDYGRTQIGKDIAEKIGTHHHVKPVRMPHKMGAQNINMKLVGTDVRIFFRNGGEPFIPKRHGVDDAV